MLPSSLRPTDPALPPAVTAPRHGVRRVVLALSVAAVVAVLAAGCATSATTPSSDPAPAASAGQPDGQDAPTPRAAVADALPPLHPAIDGLDETVVTLTTSTGVAEVRAKVAVRGEDRARGLMEVTDLPDGAGMLFLFAQERTGGFWMWNTVIPLDIAFAGADGVVHTIETMTPCEAERSTQCPVTAPPEPYRAALEVPAGWFERSGVQAGATMTWTDPVPDAG